MKVKTLLLLSIFTITVGCAPGQMGVRKEHAGAAIGAAGGGLAGAQIGRGRGQLAATAIGALAGAFIGGQVGRTMDEVDQMKAERALQQGLNQRTGHPHYSQWNSNSGPGSYQAQVTPTTDPYRTNDGRECRNFDHKIEDNRGEPVTYGPATACRQPGGHWQIVER